MEIVNLLVEEIQKRHLDVLQVIVRQRDKVIGQHDFAGQLPVLLWSVSKTFVSMAIGIARDEGLLRLEDRLAEYFPDECKDKDMGFAKMTIKHLLTMTTGHHQCPMDEVIRNNGPFDDIKGLFFNQELVYEPGRRFTYNNGATYILSRIISMVSGVSLRDYLMPRLFEPLGIQDPKWEEDIHGITFGCSGLYLTANDLSKFGQLLLNKGMWKGNKLIPADYIDEATRPHADTSDYDPYFATADHHQGYGYQIWMNRLPGTYRLDGMFGQYVVVMPEKDAVVTFVSKERINMTGILELTWDCILEYL